MKCTAVKRFFDVAGAYLQLMDTTIGLRETANEPEDASTVSRPGSPDCARAAVVQQVCGVPAWAEPLPTLQQE